MKRQEQTSQLNLLVYLASKEDRNQRLDPIVRAEVIGLLRLVLSECRAVIEMEATDE